MLWLWKEPLNWWLQINSGDQTLNLLYNNLLSYSDTCTKRQGRPPLHNFAQLDIGRYLDMGCHYSCTLLPNSPLSPPALDIQYDSKTPLGIYRSRFQWPRFPLYPLDWFVSSKHLIRPLRFSLKENNKWKHLKQRNKLIYTFFKSCWRYAYSTMMLILTFISFSL